MKKTTLNVNPLDASAYVHLQPDYRPGDIYEVTHKAESYSQGWNNHWTQAMDSQVGKRLRVPENHRFPEDPSLGVPLRLQIRNPLSTDPADQCFPWFALRFVERTNDDYNKTPEELINEIVELINPPGEEGESADTLETLVRTKAELKKQIHHAAQNERLLKPLLAGKARIGDPAVVWLCALPEPYRSLALAESAKQSIEHAARAKETGTEFTNLQLTPSSSLKNAIAQGFVWSESGEGQRFWEAVSHSTKRPGEEWPEIPSVKKGTEGDSIPKEPTPEPTPDAIEPAKQPEEIKREFFIRSKDGPGWDGFDAETGRITAKHVPSLKLVDPKAKYIGRGSFLGEIPGDCFYGITGVRTVETPSTEGLERWSWDGSELVHPGVNRRRINDFPWIVFGGDGKVYSSK